VRKCENEQHIKCEIKCEVVFAFYTLRRIKCEMNNALATVHTRLHLDGIPVVSQIITCIIQIPAGLLVRLHPALVHVHANARHVVEMYCVTF